jgi:hypothetical protein
MNHIVNFSGGICSYLAAKRVIEKYGPEDVTLLFADTKMEDPDLYRFVNDVVVKLGVNFTCIEDGRTPWEIFFDERMLGNSLIDPCSRILKRSLLDKYTRTYFDLSDTIIYIGLDWSEIHRWDRFKARMEPWKVEAPMCDRPYLSKKWMINELIKDGIKTPRLYDLGFPHNNCGGFCIKAGQAQFRLMLDKLPELYAYHESKEQEIREYLGADVSILRKTENGIRRNLTLRELRESEDFDKDEWGGCGCAIG